MDATQFKLGILGGGQLARMLILAGQPLGLNTTVLTPHSSDPGAQVCGATHLGSLEDEADLKKFLSSVDAVTFESEFVNTTKIAECSPTKLHIFPSLSSLETIQDRLTQKKLLDDSKIPTSPWLPIDNKNDLEQARKRFPNGFVLKKRRFGYDGYGTYIFKDGLGDDKVLMKSSHGFIAEEFVPFKRELAFSIARSTTNGYMTLPLVESVQKQSRCYSVCGPIVHQKLKALEKQVKAMMEKMRYCGILAIELFETERGRLIVNELAPRVHNSAHYSQNALTCSQFEYHIRAGLDWQLPKVELVRPGFAMINLLGENRDIRLSQQALGHVHWYGKVKNTMGRKMGHINTLGTSATTALNLAKKWRKDFQL